MIKKAAVPAQSIVFANDKLDNLRGAKEVGITTFLYNGFDEFIKKLQDLGVKIER